MVSLIVWGYLCFIDDFVIYVKLLNESNCCYIYYMYDERRRAESTSCEFSIICDARRVM